MDQKKVLFFSLEMTGEQLFERAAAGISNIPLAAIRAGRLAGFDQEKVSRVLREVVSWLPLKVDDTGGHTFEQLRARSKGEAIRSGVDLIIVDYLQLVRFPGAQGREREIAEISGGLKNLAKDLNIPVVALSQLNRKMEDRQDRTPRLSDLRDSGSIEQDADVVLLLHRDHNAQPSSPMFGKAELLVAKHRNGPTGSFHLRFEGQVCRFSDLPD
jgi:replicative DNA helicase